MTVEQNTSTIVSGDSIIALEQSYVKVPLEQTKRSFRNQLKIVDKDITQLINSLDDNTKLDQERQIKFLSKVKQMVTKMEQQKLEACKYRQRLEDRLEELTKLIKVSSLPSEVEFNRWMRGRSFRLIIEHLLQQGYYQSAQLLARQHGMTVDFELYSECQTIRVSLERRSATVCLAWCSENRSVLKKNKSPLEFILRRQEFIELTRERNLFGAIAYAKKHFLSFSETNEREIEQAFGLLAIKPETLSMPYQWLYDPARWNDIADLFEQENRALHGLPGRPQLVSLMFAGLSALKTYQCVLSRNERSIDCPVCSPPLSVISAKLPFSHHETSILVCPISGATMDTDNAPMALPNGHVYSQRALEKMAEALDGYIVCPRTNDKFRLVEARKCYIS